MKQAKSSIRIGKNLVPRLNFLDIVLNSLNLRLSLHFKDEFKLYVLTTALRDVEVTISFMEVNVGLIVK